MNSLFDIYATLAQSGLFDAEYYRAANPEIAQSNLDPLLHYIEEGAGRGLAPRRDFDVAYYLAQCALAGEQPENPLLHYISVGAARGLTPAPPVAPAVSDKRMIFVDAPQVIDGTATLPVRGNLSIAGWAMARAGVAEIEIAVDGVRLLAAHHGTPRPDVKATFPDWDDALRSGFVASIPHRSLGPGRHAIAVSLIDTDGQRATVAFGIEVEGRSADAIALRRKITQAEIDLRRRMLAGLEWQPAFDILIIGDRGARAIEPLQATLRSLRNQAYEDWRVLVAPRDAAAPGWRDRVLAGFDDIADRVTILKRPFTGPIGRRAAAPIAARKPVLVAVLRAGDEFACDALLLLALASGRDRAADFFYGDERRRNPHGALDVWLKPDWSPDLLWSTNYLGRAWCARAELLDRAGVTIETLLRDGVYDAVLRATAHAASIGHVRATLSQQANGGDDAREEQRALKAAAQRGGITAAVDPGRLPGTWRLKRAVPQDDLVSIIIPTRATRGLIRTCIESLRRVTEYRSFEIICIDNIPADDAASKAWLARAADRVVAIDERFNWSRFNNLAAAQARGRHLLFLNDDIEIIEPGWLSALLEHGQRAEIGAVGPQLLYPDRTIQHAGMFLAAIGTARHAFRHNPEADPGYFGLAQTQRNVIAVTGACLLTRRDTFEAVGGFDERHAIINGDLDYCLRLWRGGQLTVYTPHARLIHHERASRSDLGEEHDRDGFAQDWRGLFTDGDPFFHPGLMKSSDDVLPDPEPVRLVCAGHPILAKDAVKHILALKLDHIGDCITALPALRRLKRHFPAARLTVLAGPWAKDVWALEPAVDEVIPFEFYFAQSSRGSRALPEGELRALAERLAPYGFDLAVDLRKHPDTRAILQSTGARFLAGFEHGGRFPWLDIALEWDADPPLAAKRQHVSDDLVNLVDAIAAAAEAQRDIIAPRAPTSPPPLATGMAERLFAKPVVCLHPGAGNATKQWPTERFAALVDLLIERAGVNVVLVGGRDDRAAAAAVLAAATQRSAVFSLVGKLNLTGLSSLLAHCALFVGNDSGPKHLASGLGIATVAVHSGVVDPVEWGPMGRSAVAIRREMACGPCYLAQAVDCPRALACLTGIEVGEVFRLCTEMLSIAPARPPAGRRRAKGGKAGRR